MKEHFATYNQALALKELGYDEPCFGRFMKESNDLLIAHTEKYFMSGTDRKEFFTLAPLKSQVFQWFRDKHNLISCIRTMSYGCTIDEQEFFYEIVSVRGVASYEIYETYEEAEEASIDKLISIIKENNHEYSRK
jgi:hypothetical protein